MINSILTLAGKSVFKLTYLLLIFTLLVFHPPLFATTKLKVEKIIFTGNHTFSEGELRKILKSKEKDEFNARYMKLDQILITNYYSQRGFLDVYVSGSFEKKGEKIFIQYDINEGIRYYLREMSFVGNEIFSDDDLRGRFKIKNGAIYEKSAIETGLNEIENLYADNGKPYIIFTEQLETVSDSLMNIKIYIQEGETVTIEEIEYEGLDLVKSFLIRRELELKKNDLFSQTKIEKSQRNIYSTGLFKFVNYRLTPIENDESRVMLVWRVVEKKSIYTGLRFGVGYEQGDAIGNVTTFDISAEAGHRNLFGTARSLSLKVLASLYYGKENPQDVRKKLLTPRDQYSLTFVEPWVLNTRTPGIFNFIYSRQRQPVSVVPLTMFSASFNISHKFESPWSYTAGIAFQKVVPEEIAGVDISSVLQQVSQGQDLIYSLTFNPLKDARDNVLIPLKGYLTEIRNKFVYSNSRLKLTTLKETRDTTVTNVFYKLVFQWARHQPFFLAKKWTLASRFRVSGMLEFGGRKDIEYIPTTERYYLGGASTVRGYAEQSIGRQKVLYNPDGTIEDVIPIGGKYVLLGNVELRIPLFWLFMGEIFTDAGNLWEEIDLKSFSLKVSSGAGIAFITPFGPIRFDYGVKWFPKEGERFGEFHIGISFAF
jgi:outer membrane protein insertion porin family